VDDLLICCNNKDKLNEFKINLSKRFEMTNLGKLKYILGIQVEEKNKNLKIHQEQYIYELLKKFNLCDSKTYNTPMESGIVIKKTSDDENVANVPYASLIGSLLYLSNCTRPDITYAVNKLSSYNAKPSEFHWKCAKRILKYLKLTAKFGLTFKPSKTWNLTGYTDSDYANDLDTRKSTTGYIIQLNGSTISWNSKRQQTIATSTAESEYMALFETVRELVWCNKLINELVKHTYTINLGCDNQSTIKLAKNPVMHQRTKHIDIKYHYVRNEIIDHNIKLYYLPSKSMLADILTKPLPRPQFEKLKTKIFQSNVEETNENENKIIGEY
jgi:hypothetical protein